MLQLVVQTPLRSLPLCFWSDWYLNSCVLFSVQHFWSLQQACFHKYTLTQEFWSHCNVNSNKEIGFYFYCRLWVNADCCFFRLANNSHTFPLFRCPSVLLYLCRHEASDSGDEGCTLFALKRNANTPDTQLFLLLPWMSIFLGALCFHFSLFQQTHLGAIWVADLGGAVIGQVGQPCSLRVAVLSCLALVFTVCMYSRNTIAPSSGHIYNCT